MNRLTPLHPPGAPVRPYVANPAAIEVARIAARRLADFRHRARPAPMRRIIWEAGDE